MGYPSTPLSILPIPRFPRNGASSKLIMEAPNWGSIEGSSRGTHDAQRFLLPHSPRLQPWDGSFVPTLLPLSKKFGTVDDINPAWHYTPKHWELWS